MLPPSRRTEAAFATVIEADPLAAGCITLASLALLKERQAAPIAAAVTGKISI